MSNIFERNLYLFLMDSVTLADRFSLAIGKVGLNPNSLAKKAGVSRPLIDAYIAGSSQPTLPKIEALARVMGVRSEWLAFGSGDMQDYGARPFDGRGAVARMCELMEIVNTDLAIQGATNLRPAFIKRFRAGQTIPIKLLQELALKTETSVDWILYGDEGAAAAAKSSARQVDDVELVLVPRLDVAAAAGEGMGFSDLAEERLAPLAFRRDWVEHHGLDAGKLSVIGVRGDSMEPDLYDGDVVLVDEREVGDMVNGRTIYIVRSEDGLHLKRLRRSRGEWVLVSANAAYEPIVYNEITLLGRVAWSGHSW